MEFHKVQSAKNPLLKNRFPNLKLKGLDIRTATDWGWRKKPGIVGKRRKTE